MNTEQHPMENLRQALTCRVAEGELAPTEAATLYAETLGLEWSHPDAAISLTSFDAEWLACDELDDCYRDGGGFEELLDWIDENGVAAEEGGPSNA
jgi:hypothetical protein